MAKQTKKERIEAALKRVGVKEPNEPKRTPNHPTKSHVVVAVEGDEVKVIRFGQQGVKGSPPKKNENLANKVSTADKQKGGNQDELYNGNDPKKKLLKAKMLEQVWPQYAKTVIRFSRIHHFVDWKVFSKQN